MYIAGYKAFQENAELLDKVIAISTFGKYSHVELVFCENKNSLMDFTNAMCFSISWRDESVRFKQIDLTNGSWDLIKIPSTWEEENEIYEWCSELTNIDWDYSYLGAIGSAFKLCIEENNKTFCSKLIIKAIKENIKSCSDLSKGCLFSPNDVMKILKNREIKCQMKL